MRKKTTEKTHRNEKQGMTLKELFPLCPGYNKTYSEYMLFNKRKPQRGRCDIMDF